MKNLRSLVIGALLIPFASGLCLADGIPFLPRPYVDQNRTFRIGELTETIPVQSDSSFRVSIFKSAQKTCDIDLQKLNGTFAQLLKQDSKVFTTLNLLIDRPYENAGKLSLNILINDLGEGRKDFNSIYLPDVAGITGPVIVLDCAVASQMFWQSSLTHELTHALLHRYSVDSWFDEGVAQIMETQVGGIQPEYRASRFSNTRENPTLLEMRHPFPTGDAYAFSYLFIKYLHSRFGGWPTIRAMAGLNGDDPECEQIPSFFERSLCRAQKSLHASHDLSALAEKLTPTGILRFFSVAMAMNDDAFPIYSIPGWKGYTHPQTPSAIKPLSFAELDKRPVHLLDSRLEAYLITESGHDFQIKPFSDASSGDNHISSQTIILIVNPTMVEITL